MVDGQRLLNTCRVPRQFAPRRSVQRGLDQGGDSQEIQIPTEELGHGDLVCRVQDGWRTASGLEGRSGQGERRKPPEIGRFE